MRQGTIINPLLLSIMSQSFGIVKTSWDNPALLNSEEDQSLVVGSDAGVVLSERKKFLQISFDVLKHPFFALRVPKEGETEFPVSFSSKVEWGGNGWVDANEQTVLALVRTAVSVRVKWNKEWPQPPDWLVQALQDSHRQACVWVDVCAVDLPYLSEQWCRWSVQLGWAWWLTPPRAAGELPGFFAASKPLWRFWFVNPSSDQWVWPWCNVLVRECAQRFGPATVLPREWMADARHKNAWGAVEENAWEGLAAVVGGEHILTGLVEYVFELVGNGDLKVRGE